MKRNSRVCTVLILLIFLLGRQQLYAEAKVYSPIGFGYNKAVSAIDRFWVLYNTHVAAVKENAKVCYAGLSEVDIEIPSDAKSIPLPEHTDFNGATIRVTNNTKEFCLFERDQSLSKIDSECQRCRCRRFQA